jgi:hypothetical protein
MMSRERCMCSQLVSEQVPPSVSYTHTIASGLDCAILVQIMLSRTDRSRRPVASENEMGGAAMLRRVFIFTGCWVATGIVFKRGV